MERGEALAALAATRELAVLGGAAALEEWAPRGRALGVYVHVPFCVKRCGYCSFNTAPYRERAVPRFVRALLSEIDRVGEAPWVPLVTAATVFLGGGTPSLLTAEDLDAILARLRARIPFAPGAEVTVECNPDGLTLERLAGYRAAGVTRISLGVQSLDDRLLPALDRLHSAADARAAFAAARAAGFDNVSADLMYGLPYLDEATWERTLSEVMAWSPDHLSAYALTLDEGSRWQAASVRGLPAEEAVAAQYRALVRRARAAGFEHYEVSNYARPGRRSAHNQIYWRAQEYLGLGPGACGFLGTVRYRNASSVDRYCATLEQGALPVASHERLTERQMLAEQLILGLRLADGIPSSWLDTRIELERGRLPEILAAWQDRGLLAADGDRVRLTEEGFLLSDALFLELL